MKIKSIDVIHVTLCEPSNPGTPWHPVVVRVNTDEGISGYGEAGLTYGKAGAAAFGMIRDFSSLLIGLDPMNTEAIWERVFRQTFWGQGGGGIVFGAMSALDIALWDIKGKALGVPVYKLLGGKCNEKLRAYASQIQFDWAGQAKCLVKPEEYAEAARKALAQGYDCVKVDPIGYDDNGKWKRRKLYGLLEQSEITRAVNRVAAIREAVGPNVDIIIELHAFSDLCSAIQLAQELEKFKCFYLEEPTTPLNEGNMNYIANKINIPVASGERIYSRWGYRPFLENHSLQVIQPDIGNCGGFTEAKKICDFAHIYDVGVQMHVCGGPLATAATLQLEAAIPNFLIHEQHAAALLPKNIRSCKYDYQPVNGYFSVPELPGIGQELSDEAIETANIITVQ